MVIEWLTYQVPEPQQDRFMALDDAIWTATLARQPGFLGKQVWRAPAAPDRINLIIRWTSRDAWHAVPADVLTRTDAAFLAAFGTGGTFLGCVDLDVLGPADQNPVDLR